MGRHHIFLLNETPNTYRNILQLTQSSAYLLMQYKKADEPAYWQLMDTLFNKSVDNDHSFGINVLRLPLTSCDFSLPSVKWFTYDDSNGDYNLDHMSLDNAQYQIPILKDIITINPYIRLIGTPWTAPPWLKTTNSHFGGELIDNDQTYQTYGRFFAKLLSLYKSEHGISFFGFTLQNEPLFQPPDYAGMKMSSAQAIKLLAAMGPLVAAVDEKVKIMVWDHNWDKIDYAIDVLSSEAGKYVAGTAWHCYAGCYALHLHGDVLIHFIRRHSMFIQK